MNKLFYTELVMGGVKEFSVTLLAGEWSKYRRFASEVDAKRCIEHLKHIKHNTALAALEQFVRYGTVGKWQVSLSSVLEQGSKIKHRVNCPDGTYSVWIGFIQGDYIERVDEKGLNTYTSLNSFIRSHYAEVHPTRKGGNGWNDCETKVQGKWVKLSVVRSTLPGLVRVDRWPPAQSNTVSVK